MGSSSNLFWFVSLVPIFDPPIPNYMGEPFQ
jgi:hypothetical protein